MKRSERGAISLVNHLLMLSKKKEPKPTDKWHLDEMIIKVNGVKFILRRALDSNGQKLDVLQKRKQYAFYPDYWAHIYYHE